MTKTIYKSVYSNWSKHQRRWMSCTRCQLCETRHTVVMFRGTLPCELVYIGEAPGESEDALGSPMVGPTMETITDIHDQVEQRLNRRVVNSITNTVCCRPPENRDPVRSEIDACSTRLREFIDLSHCRYVVLMGKVAAFTHNTIINDFNVAICEVPHPSYINRLRSDAQSMRSDIVQRSAVRRIVKMLTPQEVTQ